MKHKISFISVVLLSIFLFSLPMQAQGLYKKDKETTKTQSEKSDPEGGSGIFYAPGHGGGGGSDQDGEAGNPSPVGEGLLVLSLLSGGYALLKSRNKKEK